MMNSGRLHDVKQFVDALNELVGDLGLHLYAYADVFIDDSGSNSLCKLSYDSEDGYSIEPA